MITFRYEALNAQGQIVNGQIEGENDRQAQRLLRKRGLSPVSLAPAATAAIKKKLKRKSNLTERLGLLRELAVLIEAGVPLADSIASLGKSRGEADLKTALENLSRDLRQGHSLQSAMRAHFAFLPPYVHQLVEAGEMTGQLKTALKDAVVQMEYDARVSGEVRHALIYPILLMVAGVSAVFFMFIFVVPRYADMFKNRIDYLPFVSRAVMVTGLFVRANVIYIGLVAACIVLILAWIWRQPQVRMRLIDAGLRLPVVGTWLTESETARWTAMLSTLLANRIPLLRSLELARGALGAPGLKIRLTQVERAVRSGSSLSTALDEFLSLPTSVVNLIRVGERAGNLAEMLRSAADLTQESVRQRMKQTLALIEPAAILIMGGLIGFVVVSMLLAITSLNQIKL